MRVLTYNLWHGLTPSTPVMFEALEPAGRRALREQMQVQLLNELQPDVCFFQEANPASSRAEVFSKALGAEVEFQPDLVGLKLFGIGVPLNLNSGLVTMSRYGLRRLEAVSLDRKGPNLVYSWASWQLKEERFALFTESLLPGWGRVLLINTHLHHGLEATPDFLKDMEKQVETLELSPSVASEIRERLARGGQRRRHELAVLMDRLEHYQRRYEVVILAGDFNSSPESDLGALLKDAGFHDVWMQAHPEGGGLSFDGTVNEANHMLQDRFPLTLVVEDLTFSSKAKEALLDLARRQEHRPRRIDYIWLRSNTLDLKVKRCSLEGLPNPEGLAPSDHFAVCADIG